MGLKQAVHSKGSIFALISALLFGCSVPLTKKLIDHLDPILLAGLLYLGSGVGLSGWQLLLGRTSSKKETPLTLNDTPWIVSACVMGGIIGPLCLIYGLRNTSSGSASLLLNLEGIFTALLAWFAFKENFDRRIATGMALVALGSVALSWNGSSDLRFQWSFLLIVAACFSWGIDNNLTRKISASDPIQIASIKGLVAGTINTLLALKFGAEWPSIELLCLTGILGLFSYGISLVLFVLALRHIGSARTSAYFSLAPFLGSCLSLIFWPESLTPNLIIAAILMGIGIWLHLTEHHEHMHVHEEMKHEHLHIHDEHHQHQHLPSDPIGEPHSHPHHHEKLVHTHPHFPDIHHRHHH